MPTWATRHLKITPNLELPRAQRNGQATDARRAAEWDQRIDDLLAIRQLEDDWDGQGAPAPTIDVVDSALVLALLLRQEGIVPPANIVQGVAGDVHFDWQPGDGRYIELVVTGAYTADIFQAAMIDSEGKMHHD